jgi:hypothetical protein
MPCTVEGGRAVEGGRTDLAPRHAAVGGLCCRHPAGRRTPPPLRSHGSLAVGSLRLPSNPAALPCYVEARFSSWRDLPVSVCASTAAMRASRVCRGREHLREPDPVQRSSRPGGLSTRRSPRRAPAIVRTIRMVTSRARSNRVDRLHEACHSRSVRFRLIASERRSLSASVVLAHLSTRSCVSPHTTSVGMPTTRAETFE